MLQMFNHISISASLRAGRSLPSLVNRSALFQRSFFTFPSPFGSESSAALQTYKVNKKINVTPTQMYNIVSDVSRYSEFVPFVEQSYINSTDPVANLPTEGGLRVGWKQFDEEFVCKLTCIKDQKVIAESLTTSLFDMLYTEWKFKEIKLINNTSCEVELTLKYNFKNPLYNTVSSLFSEQVTQIMIKAFEERAIELKLKERVQDRESKFSKK